MALVLQGALSSSKAFWGQLQTPLPQAVFATKPISSFEGVGAPNLLKFVG